MKRTILKTEHKGNNRHTALITLDCGHQLTVNTNKRKIIGKLWCWKCSQTVGAPR
jgi:hypothetical protein